MKKSRLVMTVALSGFLALSLSAQHYEGQVQAGVYGSATKLIGDDIDQDVVSPVFGLKLGYSVIPQFTVTLNGGYGWSYPKDPEKTGLMKYLTKYPDTPYKTNLIPVLVDVQLNFRPEKSFNPYLTWGAGLLLWDLKMDNVSVHDSRRNALADWGAGFEYFISQALGLDVSLHYQHILHQNKDMSGYGDVQSGNIEARLGLNFYFGGKKDSDGDGILDKNDRCPDQPEDMDGFQDSDGCPDLDNDNDGIPDLKDQAPDEAEDLDGYMDDDGIPDLDNDGDGVPDLRDKAPNQKEDIDGYMDEDGVPDPDNDNDGILDAMDKCPDEAETVNGYQDDDGCPDIKPEVVIEKDAPIILEGVTFESGSASVTAGAKAVLDKVVQTLADYPEMTLEVSGYTDSSGNRQANITLSQRRADAVKKYLMDQGIYAGRIMAKGYGPDKPIATNDTAEGRAKNRRIEFQRVE